MMGEIVNDLLVSLKAHLQAKMVDSIPEAYEAMLTYEDSEGENRVLKPALIKIGRLQDDPTRLSDDLAEPSAHIAIQVQDPEDMSDGWKHSVASSVDSSATNLSLHIGYPYEIGGSRRWWRRFKVSFKVFFIYSDQVEDEATRLAQLFRATLEHYCESKRPDNQHGWQCGGMEDTLGETALEAHVAKSHCVELGGPDDDYIWEGAVWIQVLTVRA
jgi:hypothetical protein